MTKILSIFSLFLLVSINIFNVNNTNATFTQKSATQFSSIAHDSDTITTAKWNSVVLDIANLISDVGGLKVYIDQSLITYFIDHGVYLEYADNDVKIGKNLEVRGDIKSAGLNVIEGGLPDNIINSINIKNYSISSNKLDPSINFGVDSTFKKNGTTAYYDDGNIGIGTNTPSERLTTNNGNIRITGTGNGIIYPDGTKQSTAAVSSTNDVKLTGDQDINGIKTFNTSLQLSNGGAVNKITDDITLVDNSASSLATEKAIKGYIDNHSGSDDGICGSATTSVLLRTPTKGLCLLGSASNIIKNANNTYSWTCSGINGGNDVSCTSKLCTPDTTTYSIAPSTRLARTIPNISVVGTETTQNYTQPTNEFTVPTGVTSINIQSAFIWNEEPTFDRTNIYLQQNRTNVKSRLALVGNGTTTTNDTITVTPGDKIKFSLNKTHDRTVNWGDSYIQNILIRYTSTTTITGSYDKNYCSSIGVRPSYNIVDNSGDLSNKTTVRTGLVGEWSLNNNTNDTSGSSNNGTAYNLGYSGPAGVLYGSFNSSSTYISAGMTGIPVGNSPRSACFNVKPNTIDNDTFISWGNNSANNKFFIQLKTDGFLRLGFFNNDLVSSQKLEVGKYYNICGTYDGTTGSLYVNGIKIGTKVFAGVDTTIGNGFNIGNLSGSSEYFNGEIGTVRVYNKALTQEEVSTINAEGFAGKLARTWSDGTVASSCNSYKNPINPTPEKLYNYTGAIGDGIYTITNGTSNVNVYCDMTTGGGGWTRYYTCNSSATCNHANWISSTNLALKTGIKEWYINTWDSQAKNSISNAGDIPYSSNIITLLPQYSDAGFSIVRDANSGPTGSNAHYLLADTSIGNATRLGRTSKNNALFNNVSNGRTWGSHSNGTDFRGPHHVTYSHIFIIDPDTSNCGPVKPGAVYYNGSIWQPRTVELFSK